MDGPQVSYCVAVLRPAHATLMVADLVRKTTVPYEVLLWLNVDDPAFEAFVSRMVADGAPIRIVGKTPENIGMRAYQTLFRQARHPLVIQTEDDVIRISRNAAEIAWDVFKRRPEARQLVADVWQDEFTDGNRPPMGQYRLVDDADGLYDGPINGWFSVYHPSIRRLLTHALYDKYSMIGCRVKQQLVHVGLGGYLCTKLKVFHCTGPAYAWHFGILESEIRKYLDVGFTKMAAHYDVWSRGPRPSRERVADCAARAEHSVDTFPAPAPGGP